MNPAAILADLRSRGLTLDTSGAALLVGPDANLNDRDRARIALNNAALLVLAKQSVAGIPATAGSIGIPIDPAKPPSGSVAAAPTEPAAIPAEPDGAVPGAIQTLDKTAADVLATLRWCGYTCTAKGDVLYVNPAKQLSEEDRAIIRAHKPGLIALVQAEQAKKPCAEKCRGGHLPDCAGCPDPLIELRWPDGMIAPRWCTSDYDHGATHWRRRKTEWNEETAWVEIPGRCPQKEEKT